MLSCLSKIFNSILLGFYSRQQGRMPANNQNNLFGPLSGCFYAETSWCAWQDEIVLSSRLVEFSVKHSVRL